MTTAFESLVQPCVCDFNHSLERDEAGRHHEYVSIVVLLDELADFWSPTESCTDALVLVEGHSDAVAGAAECDAEVNLSILYSRCHGMSDIRIVHACSCVGAEVHHLVAFAGEILNQSVLVLHAGVVVTDTYFHE